MLLGRGLADGQVLAHIFESFGADAFDGQEIVDALKSAIGFAGVQDFLRRRRADAGHLLQIGRAGGVDVDRMRGRFLLGIRHRKGGEAEDKTGEENTRCRMPPKHAVIMPE